MTLTAYPTLLEKLSDKQYRHAFSSASVRHRVALQIRALRKRKGWSQKELGRAADKPQNVISRLEDPAYGKATLQTLLNLAAAFDVALVVQFGTFGELAQTMEDLSSSALEVPSFDEELEADYSVERLFKSLLARSETDPMGQRAATEQSAKNHTSLSTPRLGAVPIHGKQGRRPESSTVLSTY